MIHSGKPVKRRPPVTGSLFFVACVFGLLCLFELMFGASRTALWITAVPGVLALIAAVWVKR